MARKAPSIRTAKTVDVTRWGVVWRSHNRADGPQCHVEHNYDVTRTFNTQRQAEAYIRQHYGYIAHRADLRREPHGWFMPVAARVRVRVEVV